MNLNKGIYLCYIPFFTTGHCRSCGANILIGVSHVLQIRPFFFFFLHNISKFFLSRKPNVQVLAVLIISSPAWPDWHGLVILSLVILLSSVVDLELTLPP